MAACSHGLYREGPEGGAPWAWPVYLFYASNLKASCANDWGYRPLSHLWTVALEGQFYLIAALLFSQVPRAWLRISLLFLTLLGPVFRWAILFVVPSHLLAATLLPFGRFDSLGAGMLVAWAVHDPACRLWLARNQIMLGLAAGLSLITCGWLSKIHAVNASVPMAAGGYTAGAVIYAVGLIRILIFPKGLIARCLQHRTFVFLGSTAYFLYLFQGLVIGLAVGAVFYRRWIIVLPQSALQLLFGLIVLCLAGWVSRKWLEQPLNNWARRFD